ncbi:PIG-L family deacetylase [Phycicoccus sp. MAQZ13P-2]|uniref:sugar-binding protein n=1 Tax=Phycicoccus mangrovi TaxID=2840470 RepID=UPI001C008AD3|nr:sugar-binding protein [Phycicoccus mangrovi]MBT9255544.1 PIG-L family deacetylase [Phycicoccus mangrovi]MBT9275258.1 PIG-L family deacetylase [Phycicoccus mangrovi]
MTTHVSRPRASARRVATLATTVALALTGAGAAAATTSGDHHGGGHSSRPPTSTTSAGKPVDLGALFIGAHPDDEAGSLSAYGQWGHDNHLRTGVVTVTRGEGGGNAVGPEEGPPLGLLREKEERSAVGRAGITDIFNLDEVDFYYTVSDPLTQEVWDHDEVLGKVVRVIRETRPEILFTMDPAPSPGNHGNHQEAARLATEAFAAAGDPTRYPEQIRTEGLRPFSPDKLMMRGSATAPTGEQCMAQLAPKDPTQTVYGVWAGATSPDGRTWAAVERDAQRQYASQGWAGFPDVPTDPTKIGCDVFRQVDSRVPFAEPGTAAAQRSWSALAGSTVHAPGTVPLGTGLRVDTDRFGVLPGRSFKATVSVTAPGRALPGASVALDVPDGWTVTGNRWVGTVTPGRTVTRTFTVTPAGDADAGQRARVAARLSTKVGSGYSDRVVEVVPTVSARQQLLPQVADFERWAPGKADEPQLSGTVTPVLPIASGRSREVRVDLHNNGTRPDAGTVALELPDGFSAEPASADYGPLAAGADGSVTFTVTNTDASLPTANQGGTPGAAAGDYAYRIVTTTRAGTSTAAGALEIVPTTTIEEASAAPVVDGKESPGEYPGEAIDISRLWEGTACSSAADCSATAKVAWHEDTLNVLVHVTDDVLGTRLDTADCKRHWRTDSVEIAIDPRGDSENTSTTFKAAVLPATAEGPACGLRDADNHQGPAAETAPGIKVASTMDEPYDGYTVEVSIPMSELPGAVDPEHLGLDLFVYDSDTQDKTGQTRIGWSTWGGVQGDPYRWGVATLPGYTPPADRPTEAPEPVIPRTALSSLDSPPSLEQAVRNDVPLAGGPASAPQRAGWVERVTTSKDTAWVRLHANAAGTAHIYVVDGRGTIGSRTVSIGGAGHRSVTVDLDRRGGSNTRVYVGWLDRAGGTLASVARPR